MILQFQILGKLLSLLHILGIHQIIVSRLDSEETETQITNVFFKNEKAAHYGIRFTDLKLQPLPIPLLFFFFHQLQCTMHFNHTLLPLPFLSP